MRRNARIDHRIIVPPLAALAVAASFAYAERIPTLPFASKGVVLALPFACMIAVIVAATASLAPRKARAMELLGGAFTPALLAVTAYGHFLLLAARPSRVALAILAALLVFVSLRVMARRDERSPEWAGEYANMSYALHVLSLYFLASFGSALAGPLQIPVAFPAVVIGLVAGLATAITLRRCAVGRRVALVSVAYGVFATELFAALSSLPVAFYVSGAVFAIMAALGLYVAARGLPAGDPLPRLRRYALASAILVVIVLISARWS